MELKALPPPVVAGDWEAGISSVVGGIEGAGATGIAQNVENLTEGLADNRNDTRPTASVKRGQGRRPREALQQLRGAL